MSVRQAARAPAPARAPRAPAEAATNATGAPVAPLLCPGPHRPLAHVLQAGAAHAAAPTGFCMSGERCVSILQEGYGSRAPNKIEFSYAVPAMAGDMQAFLDVFMPAFERNVIAAFGSDGMYYGGYVCIANKMGQHTKDHRFYLPVQETTLSDEDGKFPAESLLQGDNALTHFFKRIMDWHRMYPGAEVPLYYTAPAPSPYLRTTRSPADADADVPMETPTDGKVMNMFTRTRNKVFGARTAVIDKCRMFRLDNFKMPGRNINVNYDFWDQACDLVFPTNGAAPLIDKAYAEALQQDPTLPLPLTTMEPEMIMKGVEVAKAAVEQAQTDLKNLAERAYLNVSTIAAQNGIPDAGNFMANHVYITFDMDFARFGNAYESLDASEEKRKHFHILTKQEVDSRGAMYQAAYVDDNNRLNTVFKHLKAMANKKILLVGFDTDYGKPKAQGA